MKLREHRGSLTDSMATLVEIPPTRKALTAHINKILGKSGMQISRQDVHVNGYYRALDRRIGWERTYIVTVDNYGPFGFCDENPL